MKNPEIVKDIFPTHANQPGLLSLETFNLRKFCQAPLDVQLFIRTWIEPRVGVKLLHWVSIALLYTGHWTFLHPGVPHITIRVRCINIEGVRGCFIIGTLGQVGWEIFHAWFKKLAELRGIGICQMIYLENKCLMVMTTSRSVEPFLQKLMMLKLIFDQAVVCPLLGLSGEKTETHWKPPSLD